MTITNVKTGVLGVDDVYKKTLSEYYTYESAIPFTTLTSAGSLFGWGNNFTGENVAPINNGKSSPTQIPGTTWARLSGQNDAFAAIKSDGTMWVWGTAQSGSQMANDGASTGLSSPIQMPGTAWCALARSVRTHLAIKSDGTLWSAGYGADGTNGDNTNIARSSMVQVPGTTWCCLSFTIGGILALKTDNTLWAWGARTGTNTTAYFSSPVQIPGTTWCNISQNQSNRAIKTDNTMWTWGSGSSGMLGISSNNPASSPIQIPGTTWCCAGGFEDGAFAVKNDGTAWAWGHNNGKLGINSTAVSYFSSPVQIPGTTWKKVCGSNGNIHGLKSDGSFWGWGSGTGGGLGLNDNISRSSPVQIPGTWCQFHSMMQTQAMAIR